MNIVENKKARFDYFIEDTYNCGMVLTSPMVKHITNGHTSLVDKYAFADSKGITAIVGVRDGVEHIPLLLNKEEIRRIHKKLDVKGYTLIPLSIYRAKNHKLKLSLGVCRGKKEYDKRETIKQRDHEREMRKAGY